jgi:branched-chain amino acid transport system ATP-binding protein
VSTIPANPAELLSVEAVSVSFGGLRALDGVSFGVPEGSTVGLIGPNGAGKTTMFNIVSGLQRHDAGRVTFAGTEITTEPPHRRARRGIARSFQNLGLINEETVLTNLLAAQYGAAPYRGLDVAVRPWRWWRSERQMQAAAVDALARFGLGDLIDRRVEDLSFASARFVEMACVLVNRPRLMLLDEPTTGLDLVEVELLLGVLDSARAEGATTLVVAHDVRFVMRACDYVYVLAQGRVLSHGTPAEVQQDPSVITEYLGTRR